VINVITNGALSWNMKSNVNAKLHHNQSTDSNGIRRKQYGDLTELSFSPTNGKRGKCDKTSN
jgi:hypothetical protein